MSRDWTAWIIALAAPALSTLIEGFHSGPPGAWLLSLPTFLGLFLAETHARSPARWRLGALVLPPAAASFAVATAMHGPPTGGVHFGHVLAGLAFPPAAALGGAAVLFPLDAWLSGRDLPRPAIVYATSLLLTAAVGLAYWTHTYPFAGAP